MLPHGALAADADGTDNTDDGNGDGTDVVDNGAADSPGIDDSPDVVGNSDDVATDVGDGHGTDGHDDDVVDDDDDEHATGCTTLPSSQSALFGKYPCGLKVHVCVFIHMCHVTSCRNIKTIIC